MRFFKLFPLLLLAALSFAACSEDDAQLPEPTPTPTPTPVAPTYGEPGVYVINQGNVYSKLLGTLSFLPDSSATPHHEVFAAANGMALGDNPQGGALCEGKLYLALGGSQLVWVVDPHTHKALRSITTASPQGIIAHERFVYVTNNDGYLTQIDATADTIVRRIAIGPNPVGMAIRGGYLYAAISDGYNSANDYREGFRVAKVSLATFEKVADIRVGMNPLQLAQDAQGQLFVLCRGNYGVVPSTVYRIDAADRATPFCTATLMAASDSLLYTINAVTDWSSYQTQTTTAVYNTRTTQPEPRASAFQPQSLPVDPIAMAVRPQTGELFISSRAQPFVYTQAGYVQVYNAQGALLRRFNTGVEPYAFVFK